MTGPQRVKNLTGGAFVFPLILIVTTITAVLLAMGVGPAGVEVFVVLLGGWLITLCLHEFAHAAVALAGGDVSVRARGYLTLNLLRYTDPANSIVIPLILLAVGGIPLPGGSVLVEPHRLRRVWWASLVSAAGPLVNLVAGALITTIAATVLGSSPLGGALAFLGLIQFIAGILNLLPIPGFDGFGIIAPYLSRSIRQAIAPFQPWAPLAVFALLWSLPALRNALFDGGLWLFDLVGGDRLQSAWGQSMFQFWR